MQTTAIDQTAGIVNLTTLLAHSSGEMDRLGLADLRHKRDGNDTRWELTVVARTP